jgi:hypothetical protein
VVFAGIALGTFLGTEALVHGVVLPLGLNGTVSAAITFVLIVALAVVLAELTRRHHRAIGRQGWRYGKRGAIAAARGAAAWSRPGRSRITAAMRARWAARGPEPLMFRRRPAGSGEPGAAAAAGPEAGHGEERAEGPGYSWGLAGARHHWPASSREEAEKWARHMSGDGRPREVAEYPPGGGPGRTVATYVNGKPSDPPQEGSTTMPASKIEPGRRARRAAARAGGTVPSEWAPVIAAAADFEPENDGELLEWMTRQLIGLSGWAEALVDFYEHATSVIGIDPKAAAMLHDVADAAAQAAETMGAARARFTEHYELPREFAANGGLMTHDGRWVTGEGA